MGYFDFTCLHSGYWSATPHHSIGPLFGRVWDMDDPFDPWPIPDDERTAWSAVNNIYQRWLPPIILLGTLIWLGFVFFLKPARPPIGSYIASLALLAVVVTIWPPESNWSKAAWLAVFFALTGLEICTLYRERSDNQAQQAQSRIDEDNRFAGILEQSQKQFDATMAKTGTILDETQTVARLAENSLDNLTGGDSVAYIAPQAVQNGRVPLVIVNAGRYPLTGVTIIVMDWTTLPFKTEPTIFVGTLASHAVRGLDVSINPLPGRIRPVRQVLQLS